VAAFGDEITESGIEILSEEGICLNGKNK